MRLRCPLVVLLALLAAAFGSLPASAAPLPMGRVPAALGTLGPWTDLTIDRLNVGDEVAAAKFGTGRPIDDPTRERQLLDHVRAAAQVLEIDADAAVRIFADEIEANKVVQRGLFTYWQAHPQDAPATRPDLATLREELDRLTTAILAQLALTDALRHTALPCRVQLSLAVGSGTGVHQLDRLHRQALAAAVPSICPALRQVTSPVRGEVTDHVVGHAQMSTRSEYS